WSGACTGTSPCVVTMSAARSVTATIVTRPTVTLLSSTFGWTGGGGGMTVHGTGFEYADGATTIFFGTQPATSVQCFNSTSCNATGPSATGPGTVDITVTADGMTSLTSPADRFTYYDLPAVASINPTSGPVIGGTLVTITGSGFSTVPGAIQV